MWEMYIFVIPVESFKTREVEKTKKTTNSCWKNRNKQNSKTAQHIKALKLLKHLPLSSIKRTFPDIVFDEELR